MHKVQRVSSLRAAVSAARNDKKIVGFVPTMGNLHSGHLELVKIAKQKADFVVVSIFVNPTQFSQGEDLSNYPSTPEEDARLLAELGADLLFLPEKETMYPGELKKQTVVYVPDMGDRYCGVDRPEHFYGVTTVVARLFNMVQPDLAVFGKKDYQQLAIVRQMVQDLAFPVEIVGVETVRTPGGLALSSRNGYLSSKELEVAEKFNETLRDLAASLAKGPFSKKVIKSMEKDAKERLVEAGFDPHYISVCRQSDLRGAGKKDRALVILAAATLGPARLIDNIEISI